MNIDRKKQVENSLEQLRQFYQSGATRPLSFRRSQLKNLRRVLQRREEEIFQALKADLNKSKAESFMSEVLVLFDELKYLEKHLPKLARPKRKLPGIGQLPGSLQVIPEPLGVVLVISPWNYPLLLSLDPVLAAISAGNTVLLKPSAYSPSTSALLKSLCEEAFPSGLVQVIEGGREENKALLNQRFDYIFFTGSPAVGKTVMRAASKHLTPITLELGGKSPCIVDATADLEKTAKRILFGKLMNAGQTCIAPDYIYVEASVKDRLIQELLKGIEKNFPLAQPLPESFPKIIQPKHFERIVALLENQKLLYPKSITYPTSPILDESRQQIYPVLVDEPSWKDPLMKEEIFGPVLPILSWENATDMVKEYKNREKPLALYVFSKDKNFINKTLEGISSGGVTVNDTLLHIASSRAPFGGVGNSGMGSYHGKESFRTFSHERTVLKKWWSFDLPQRYLPISEKSYLFLRKLTGN